MDSDPTTVSWTPQDYRDLLRQVANPFVADTGTDKPGGVQGAIIDMGAYEYDPNE